MYLIRGSVLILPIRRRIKKNGARDLMLDTLRILAQWIRGGPVVVRIMCMFYMYRVSYSYFNSSLDFAEPLLSSCLCNSLSTVSGTTTFSSIYPLAMAFRVWPITPSARTRTMWCRTKSTSDDGISLSTLHTALIIMQLWPHSLYGISLGWRVSRMTNQHGRWVRWMPTSRKNRFNVKNTHTQKNSLPNFHFPKRGFRALIKTWDLCSSP